MESDERFHTGDSIPRAIQTAKEDFSSRLNFLRELVAREEQSLAQNQLVQKVRETQQDRLLNELVEDAHRWYGIVVSLGEAGSPHAALETIVVQFKEIQSIIEDLERGNVGMRDIVASANEEKIIRPFGIDPELFDQATLHYLTYYEEDQARAEAKQVSEPRQADITSTTRADTEVAEQKQRPKVEKRVNRKEFSNWMIEVSQQGEQPLIEEIAAALGISIKATRTHMTRLKTTLENDQTAQFELISVHAGIPKSRAHRFYLVERPEESQTETAGSQDPEAMYEAPSEEGESDSVELAEIAVDSDEQQDERKYIFESYISRKDVNRLIKQARDTLISRGRRTSFHDNYTLIYAWFPQIPKGSLATLAQQARVEIPTGDQKWNISLADIVSLLVANEFPEDTRSADPALWGTLRNYVKTHMAATD